MGAPLFVISATATLFSHSPNTIQLWLGRSDRMIRDNSTLPTDTIVFNCAAAPAGANASTTIQTCVPPGTYFVSCFLAVGSIGAGGTHVVGSIAINAIPVTATDGASAASLLPAAWASV